jgi:predicted nuclease of predicted toxin-antitoxin system
VSKDKDFLQHSIVLGAPPKFIWIAIGNCSTDDVLNLLTGKREVIFHFLADPVLTVLVLR